MGILTWLFHVGPYSVFPQFPLVVYPHSKPGHLLRSQCYPWGLDEVEIRVLTYCSSDPSHSVLKVLYALELPGEVAVPLLRDSDLLGLVWSLGNEEPHPTSSFPRIQGAAAGLGTKSSLFLICPYLKEACALREPGAPFCCFANRTQYQAAF